MPISLTSLLAAAACGLPFPFAFGAASLPLLFAFSCFFAAYLDSSLGAASDLAAGQDVRLASENFETIEYQKAA